MTSYLIRLALICLGVLPLWLALRRPWKRRPVAREVMLGAFAVFMAGILSLALEGQWTAPDIMAGRALERVQTGRKINAVPLLTLRSQLAFRNMDESLTQLLGNTLLFVPWGFFLPMLWRRFRHPLVMMGMGLLLTCGIEGTQLFIERMVDVDDILLNFAGSMAGAGLWVVLHRLWPKMDSVLAVK